MEPEKKAGGAFVGLVVIVIILILGGIYMWKVNKDATKDIDTGVQTEAQNELDTNELNMLEQEISTIDTDLGVDVGTID